MEEDDGEDGDEGDEGDAAADEGDGQQEQEDIPMAEEDDASIHVFEGHTDAVLGGSPRNELHGVLLNQLRVDGHVLLLRQDGVVHGHAVPGCRCARQGT